jgi:hypothetical protein
MLQRAIRLPSRVLVQIRSDRGGFDATIGNLSPGGARLLGVPDGILAIGDHIEIQCQGRAHRAEVRWRFDDTCGLQFAHPLEPSQIETILASRTI